MRCKDDQIVTKIVSEINDIVELEIKIIDYKMAQMIQRGSELLRINTQKNDIEYSKDGGRTWHHR